MNSVQSCISYPIPSLRGSSYWLFQNRTDLQLVTCPCVQHLLLASLKTGVVYRYYRKHIRNRYIPCHVLDILHILYTLDTLHIIYIVGIIINRNVNG
jgi:hypothetical protein